MYIFRNTIKHKELDSKIKALQDFKAEHCFITKYNFS